jgi:hypothetical protein
METKAVKYENMRDKIIRSKDRQTLRNVIDDQCDDVGNGGKIVGAFSTSHPMVSALPAMSLNSAAGLRERISVAAAVVA